MSLLMLLLNIHNVTIKRLKLIYECFIEPALDTKVTKSFFFSEKTELFLELYGNLQVRAQSLEYVEKMSTEFIQ